jgi:leucyl/phenylalanyl-tRNA---protein transferase
VKLFVKSRRIFPDPQEASIDGIVAMGDALNVNTLLEAYSFGIFPWPHPELPILWYSPDPRGVLDFKDLYINRSFRKFLSKCSWQVSFNKNFSEVMRACSVVPRPGQSGTWITQPMLKAYEEFHQAGYAHSIEVWEEEDLVGGLYGVYVAGVFSGESMFFRRSNASKVALYAMIQELRRQGLEWMDIQMLTPVTESMGGNYISRDQYYARLEAAKRVAKPLNLKGAWCPIR